MPNQSTVTAEIDRKTFIGGSDAPAILSLSRWKTLLQVWAEKTGAIQDERVESIAMKVGKALESTVITLFCDETGLEVESVDQRLYHPRHSFISAQVDARIKGEKAFLEVKTCTIRKAKEWAGDDEIPTEYIIQTMHDLAVTGDDHAYVAVLIGNEDFKWRKVLRDEKMIAEIEKRECDIWNNYILPKAMPQVITADDSNVLYRLFPQQKPGVTIDLGDEGARLIEMRNALHQDHIALEDQIEKIENDIKFMLKEAETGIAGLWKATWKAQTRKAHAVKESTFRKFNISKLGGHTNGND